MHVAIRASSVYVKSWTVHRSDLSSAPTIDFVDAAEFINVVDLISAAKFDIVLLCHSNIVSSSLGHSIVQTYHQPLLPILSTLLNLTLLLNSSMLSNSTLSTVSKLALFCQCTPNEFNPVTNLPHQKKSTSSSNQFWSTFVSSLYTITVQGRPHTTSWFWPYSHPEWYPSILQCQADILVINPFLNQAATNIFSRVLLVPQQS